MEHCFLIKICENCALTVPASAVIVMLKLFHVLSLLVHLADSNVNLFIWRRSISPSQFVWRVVCKSVPERCDRRSRLQFIDKLLLFILLPSLVVGSLVTTLINGFLIVLGDHKM